MTTESPFVTLDEIASTPGPTYGLTERQVKFDIRNGYLPGEIDRRSRIVIRRGEWNQFLAGTWPSEAGESRNPVGIVSIREKAS